ncbi:MAG TPA: alginate O-acetyltransferase [Verrucomicrobiae bacterium]|nr:alginate O-acetyltransferase [Verrucomicrobiae bacterium]
MRALTILQSSLFATFVLGMAAVALARAVPYEGIDGASGEAEWLDGRAARAFEGHYDERFPGKTLGTNLWAAIDYVVFDEGRPGVVVGANGWLYTDEEFKTYPGAEAAITSHLALIATVRDELKRQGSELVIALVPSKARVYPEHLPERRPAAIHESLYGRLRQGLRDAGIAAPDLAVTMARCKRAAETYLRTDTHWTPAGARCAAQAVAATLGSPRKPPFTFYTHTASVETHSGDLLRFLPLEPYFASLLPERESVEVRKTERAAAGQAESLLGDGELPQVVLVGTSYSADPKWNFTGALQESLQEDVVNYASVGKGPFVPMLDYLLNSAALPAAPRLVVWEIPERYLPLAQDLSARRPDSAAVCTPNPGKAASTGDI